MYNGLLHAHSGLRWIVLVLLVWALVQAISGWQGKKDYRKIDRLSALLAMIFTHIQLLIGLVLYFISPKVAFREGMMGDSVIRFFTVEHILMMLISIALITVGFSVAKRTAEAAARHKKIAVYYGLGLLIMLIAIPWPFRGLGAGWM